MHCHKRAYVGRAREYALPLLLVMLICMSAMLSGCRYSDTLLEVIIDPATGVLEAHADPEYRDIDGAPPRDDLASIHLAENENLADQENFLPVYKEDAPSNGQAVRRVHSEETPDDSDASQGNEAGESSEANSSTSEETEVTEENTSSSEGENNEQEQVAEDGDQSQPDKTSGRGGTGQVYGDGSYDELPDVHAIAAKGQYALITQMLSGTGGLAAADAQWIADMQAKGAFPGEGLENIAVVWDAEGRLDVQALIGSDADALLVDGVDVVITDEENAAITAAGINIIYVPILGKTYTADKDIVAGVKVVGQVLSGFKANTKYDTATMVEKYIELHDKAINGCVNANGGYSYKMVIGEVYKSIYQGTTLTGEAADGRKFTDKRISTACIDSWTSAAGSSMSANREFGFQEIYLNGKTIDTSDGVGLSAETVGTRFILADYYLQAAGIINNAYDTPMPISKEDGQEKGMPFAITAGTSEGVTARQVGARKVPSALWFSETGVLPTDHWILVGDKQDAGYFPGVIVRDDEIAQKIERSAAKPNGLYNVGQPYQIYQIPEGIAGNWLDGNVESFMTSLWAFDALRGNDSTSLLQWTDGFYELFYRIPPNESSSHLAGLDSVRTAQCPRVD